MKRSTFYFSLLLFISCSKTFEKPKYLFLTHKKDSLIVKIVNKQKVPTFLKIEDLQKKQSKFINLFNKDTIPVLKFLFTEIDTANIFKNYRFNLSYGDITLKRYDTFYNYNLPFPKGQKYKILQGNNGNFSHNKPSSRYAIDFKMNIGQEVCAIRDGYIVYAKKDSDEGGGSRKYLDKANKIFVYHKDGTFAQYAHFKKDGVLVKKGDSIKKGEIIGYSGNTGFSTEPHLHFVIYKPTKNGLQSIPFILDSIPSKRYTKGKFAINK